MVIKGNVDVVLYENEENGYKVLILDADGEPVTVTGSFPALVEGQALEIEGDFSVHKKYGRQFRAERVTLVKNTGVESIVRYLGSGLIKGIGPMLALRIVSVFGEKTFEVIEFSPSLLATVKGISKKKAIEIHAAYTEIKDMQEAVMTLQSYDIPLGTAMKIYKQYGKETSAVVSANPYRLIEDVDGIGFLTADRIAQRAGIEKTSEFRVAAGVIHTLKEKVHKEGNTCFPRDDTVTEAARLLGVDEELVAENITRLVLERRLRLTDLPGFPAVVLPAVFHTEKHAAVLLSRLIGSADKTVFDVSGDIEFYERTSGITLHGNQREAVTAAIENGVCLITGGPGTGKTTIIKCIIEILDKIGKSVMLVAPTGRAAKRMSEATGRDASTIHRACGFSGGEAYGGCDESLTADAIIVDEFSMVDIFLFEAMLNKIQSGTRLILVGDKDQLPSVGAGNVLADLLRSGEVRSVQLTQIYRQAQESLIVTNAHAVNRGEMPVLGDKTHDFFYTAASDPELIAQKTVDMVERAAKYISVTPDRVQVLCPMKNGAAGAISVNRRLQQRLNPPVAGERTVESEDYIYRRGDKVMHTVNNYELEWTLTRGYLVKNGTGVFNGDVGTIADITDGGLTVQFEDGRVAQYTPDIYNQLVLSYAVTVHKSQGSEFDAVIIPVAGGGPMIMTRNLLYTAITRAKKMVVMIGEQYKIKSMVDNDFVAARYSLLKELLIEARRDEALLFGGNE